MAKRNYLGLTNLILGRIKQSAVADMTTLTAGSHSDLISEYINDAQNVLMIEDNWYTLITEREIASGTSGTLAVASDFDKSLVLVDKTNKKYLVEGLSRDFLMGDAGRDDTGPPTRFSAEGTNYRFDTIPTTSVTLTDVYWKQPTSLSANTDSSDLPLICEPLIIKWVESEIFAYVGNTVKSELALRRYNTLLPKAMDKNQEIVDRMIIVDSDSFDDHFDSRTRIQTPIS